MDVSDSRSLSSPSSQRDHKSPTMEGQQQADEKQQKKRTKTGCQTCRTRRIKCDETKPECLKCIKSNRKCEGTVQYEPRKSRKLILLTGVGYGVKREGTHSEKKSRRYMPYGDKEGRPSYKNIVPAPPKPAETIAVVAPAIAMAISGDAAKTRSPKRKRDEDIDGAEYVERIGMSFVEELRLTV